VRQFVIMKGHDIMHVYDRGATSATIQRHNKDTYYRTVLIM